MSWRVRCWPLLRFPRARRTLQHRKLLWPVPAHSKARRQLSARPPPRARSSLKVHAAPSPMNWPTCRSRFRCGKHVPKSPSTRPRSVNRSRPWIGRAAAGSNHGSSTGAVPAAAPAASALAAGPRAISLHAYDGKYTAMVEVNGQAIPVRAGDTLDGGWKVAGIDDAGIKIVNGKRVRILRP